MYVTLSEDYDLDRSQWTAVGPAVPAKSSQLTYTLYITDALLTENMATWFTVQARDSFGNWSVPATPVWGQISDRTPPAPAAIEDPELCQAHPMPLLFSGLDSDAIQARLYRRFDAPHPADPFANADDWQLIRQFTITDAMATIDDQYIPPQDLDLYYALELVDGNGNVSTPIYWCSAKEGGDAAFAPQIDPNDKETAGNMISFDNGNEYDGFAEITIAGEDGPEMYTVAIGSNLPFTPALGLNLFEINNEDGDNAFAQLVEYWNVNNFLDTNRQMSDLGPMHSVQWLGNGTTLSYTVELDFAGESCNCFGKERPLVTVFRRTADSNWTQVISVTETHEVKRYLVLDSSDPDPTQEYQYMALAFSPVTYEVLGFWHTYTLTPHLALEPLELTTPLERPIIPGSSQRCYLNEITPHGGQPTNFTLADGWSIYVDKYYLNTGSWPLPPLNCPTATTLTPVISPVTVIYLTPRWPIACRSSSSMLRSAPSLTPIRLEILWSI